MISVCIATYNGEKYIKEQLESILPELDPNDEVVICDDNSTDFTIDEINKLVDPRINIYRNLRRLGHVRNFEKAMLLAKGEYILLSDQDDVWIKGRVALMKKKAEEDICNSLVASNYNLIDENGKDIGVFRNLLPKKNSILKQLILILAGKSQYFGCTFLLKRELLATALPIPGCVESHDIWLALIASAHNKVANIMEPTLLHRIHSSNATPKKPRPLLKIIKSRVCYIISLSIRVVSHKIKRFYVSA